MIINNFGVYPIVDILTLLHCVVIEHGYIDEVLITMVGIEGMMIVEMMFAWIM